MIILTCLPLLAFCSVAALVIPAFIGFAPVSVGIIIVMPAVVLGFGLLPIKWIRQWLAWVVLKAKEKEQPKEDRDAETGINVDTDTEKAESHARSGDGEEESEGTGTLDRAVQTMLSEQGELALKIGMVIVFVSVVHLAWYLDHFYSSAAPAEVCLRHLRHCVVRASLTLANMHTIVLTWCVLFC